MTMLPAGRSGFSSR